MKNLSFLLSLISLVSSTAFGKAINYELNSYKSIAEVVEALGENKEAVLLAFDIDHTLLLVDDCNGSGNFFKYVWACPGVPTESGLAHRIAEWQKQGYHTMALTARSHHLIEPTERELLRNDFIFLDAPYGSDSNFEEKVGEKAKVVLKDGVVYAGSKNKGDSLNILMDHIGSYKTVLFVDDNIKNIKSLNRVFKDDKNTDVHIVHYTKHIKKDD